MKPLLRTAVLALIITSGPAPEAVSQRVDRVEPPNWWIGMRWDAVQLMVYGADLEGATASFDAPGLSVTGATTLDSPSYLFVDVGVSADLEPGTYDLTIRKGAWEASVPWRLEAREDGGKAGFSSEDVVYLVTPDRFANGDASNDAVAGLAEAADRSRMRARHGGDLRGLIDRLDYLADLGVTALWLNPVLENAGRQSYHGYAATDLYRVDPRFGTNADYRELAREAHARGLKVIFDHVANHIGIGHPWIDDLPSASWLNGTREDHLLEQHYKLSFVDAHGDPETVRRQTTFWFVDSMPDLDQRDPYLARYLIQNTLWWIEYAGLDGIREDTWPYADQDFMADWMQALLAEYPDFVVVGEIWEPYPAYLAAWQQGSPGPAAMETHLPSVMDFALTDAMRAYVEGGDGLGAIYAVLAQDFLYADPDRLMTFVDNHDMPRLWLLAGDDPRRAEQMLAVLLTTRGIPQLLYGTEIGMVGGRSHVELRADFPGGFPGDQRSAFVAQERTPDEARAFDLVRTLLHVRRSHPALRSGEFVHYPPSYGDPVYRYLRIGTNETVLILLNGDERDRMVSLDLLEHRLPADAGFRDLMTGDRVARGPDGAVPVPGLGFRVLLLDPVSGMD